MFRCFFSGAFMASVTTIIMKIVLIFILMIAEIVETGVYVYSHYH